MYYLIVHKDLWLLHTRGVQILLFYLTKGKKHAYSFDYSKICVVENAP